MFKFRCKGINISRSIQIFGQNIVCTKKDKNMKNIAILASGEGTNAERIIRYFEEKEEVNVAVVIASRASAGVIKRVEHLHVPCKVVTSAGFVSGEALQVLQEYKTDFVVLAGFLLRIRSRSSEGKACMAFMYMKRF